MSEKKDSSNIVIAIIAKGNLAELRVIHDNCDDAETARPIYTELRRLAYEFAKKHHFDDTKGRARLALLATSETHSWPKAV